MMKLKRFNFCLASLIFLAVRVEPLAAQNINELSIPQADNVPARRVYIESGAWLPISIPGNKPWKRISRGSTLEGCLSLSVYSGEAVAIPAGTKLRLIVDSIAEANDESGKWRKLGRVILRVFDPFDNRPAPEYIVHMNSVEAILPDASPLPLKAHVLRAANRIIVLPGTRHGGSEDRSQLSGRPVQPRARRLRTALLHLDEGILWPTAGTSQAFKSEQLASADIGRARAFLLTALSASQNREGDRFQAQLAEPVRLAGQLFEAGSLLEGSVLRSRAPRILSRAGSLRLRVDHLRSRQGQTLAITGTLASAEANAQTRFELDKEGGLRGLKPGLKNVLVDLGTAYALGKVADDVSETPIRAIGVAVSDAAVANAARYVGLGTSAVFLVARHGRDVYLPKYAEITIEFGRFGEEPSLAPIETLENGSCDF